MSNISILGGDFEILFDDETVGGNAVAGMKMVRRTSGAGATVYTTNQLYSAVAEVVDDFIAMGFENPMLPVTPQAYTMENDYFIPRSSTEFLQGGAITADWSSNIRSIEYTDVTSFVAGDVGRQVVGGTTTDTGTLLDFETLPNGNLLLWIRPDDPATDLFDNNSETLSVTADGGTGSGTASASSTTGVSLYSSIQVIGAVPTNTEVYLYQDRIKMTSSDGTFQWWATDPTLSLGIIDILVRVQKDSVSIADGDVEVFGRRYTSLYDNFRLNVSGGGRSALPLASSTDINNTTGYLRANFDNAGGASMLVGDLLTNTTQTGGFAVVTEVISDGGATGTFAYYLVGELIDFANNDAFTSSNRTGDIDGAPVANLGGPTDTASGEGGTVTIVLGTTTNDHDGDGIAEPYSITVNAQNNVIAAKVYERIKYATRRGAPNTDLFGAGVNVPGESYRGLEAQIQWTSASGTFTEGDDVNTATGTWTARVISHNVTDTYMMVTDQQTSLDTVGDANVIKDEGGDDVTVSGAPDQFAVSKQSPLGTFTGTQIFGTRGVLFINPDSADVKNYILTDDNNTQRTPPNTVSVLVQNTEAGDRILVADDNGTTGIIDKDRFGGLRAASAGANDQGDQLIEVAGSVDSDVPASGFVRIIDVVNQEEHRYVYNSRTTGSSGVFTLRDVEEGTGATSSSASQIIDTTADFTDVTNPVTVGMLVRNTFAGKETHVWEVQNVVSSNTLDVVALYGPLDATQDWDSGNTYEINHLIGEHTSVGASYTAADNIYAPIIDEEATGSSVTNSLVQSTSFGIVGNVRQGKVILPFTQNSTVNATGATITTVRAEDTIAV